MKASSILMLAGFVLLPFCLSPLFAQEQTKNETLEKKVTIVKRTIQSDGSESTETIVKTGKAAENFDADQYIKENTTEKDKVEVIVTERDADKHFHWNNVGSCNSMAWAKSCDDKGAFLGVEEDSDEDPAQPGLVVQVVRGAAAEKAGLRDNDKILKLNDTPTNKWEDLSQFIQAAKPGDKVTITYTRNGATQTSDATLITRKDIQRDEKTESRGFLGVSDEDENGDQAGVSVTITKTSGAEKAGLLDGDVILKLDQTNIADFEDISDFMAYTKPGQKVLVTFERQGQQKTAEAVLSERLEAAEPFYGIKAPALNMEHLKGLEKLKEMKSLEGMKGLAGQAPTFSWTQKEKEACLGVYSTQTEDKGSTVTSFTELSAAREAGMNEQDVILSVNGNLVNGHSELWDEIAKYKTGDKVNVAYEREGKPMQVQATLKACRDQQTQVDFLEKTLEGLEKNRRFYTWNWDDSDGRRLQETRIIIIRRAGDGDAEKVNISPESKPAADRGVLTLELFRAFPNPSQGQVTVEFKGEAVATVVSLLDISGRQLFREELNAFNGEYSQQFDLTAYAKGAIVIQVQQGEKVYSEQIIVN